ncbi:MAG: hypothetical protein ACE5KD_04355 [Candidatus Bathyarchaeia archaeon]
MNVKPQPELIMLASSIVCPRKIRKKPKAIAIAGGFLANIFMNTVADIYSPPLTFMVGHSVKIETMIHLINLWDMYGHLSFNGDVAFYYSNFIRKTIQKFY